MTTARKELLDFFESANHPAVRVNDFQRGYDLGYSHGHDNATAELKASHNYWQVVRYLIAVAGVGTAFFLVAL